jgi:hypothetical protein
MDLTKLSDEDLLALKAGDITKLSNEALLMMREPEQATFKQKVISSAPARIMQGARDPIDAAAQLLPRGLEFVTSAGGLAPNPVSEFFGSEAQRVDQGISEAEKQYEQARKATGQTGYDFARFTGNVISPANLAIAAKLPVAATTGARIMQGGAIGAVGGGLQPIDTAQNPDFASTKAGQVALGAATGAVATPIMGAVGDRILKYASGKLQASKGATTEQIKSIAEESAKMSGVDFDRLNNLEKQQLYEQVRRASDQFVGKDPATAMRAAAFQSLDIPYTQGQITRDPMQFATEKNLSQLPGTGSPLQQRFSEQGARLRSKLGEFSSGAIEDQAAGAAITNSLKQVDDRLSQRIGDAYKVARQSAGKDAEVPMQGIAQDFAEIMRTAPENVKRGIPTGAFDQYGLSGMKQTKLFTVEEADKLLKSINASQSNDKAVNNALNVLRNSVKRAVIGDAGVDDVFAPARSMAAQRFKLQEAIPALEASANGTVNPDTFVQNFIISKNAQTSQVKQMADMLRKEDPQAFEQARAQLGSYIQRKAIGENTAGDKGVSPERLATALRELGSEKMRAFFSPEEVSKLQTITKVGSYIESVPFSAKPNTSGNWGAITQLPGVPQSAALVAALKNSFSNQMNVSRSLSEKIPTQLKPEEIQLLSRVLAGGALTSGAMAAQPLK